MLSSLHYMVISKQDEWEHNSYDLAEKCQQCRTIVKEFGYQHSFKLPLHRSTCSWDSFEGFRIVALGDLNNLRKLKQQWAWRLQSFQ